MKMAKKSQRTQPAVSGASNQARPALTSGGAFSPTSAEEFHRLLKCADPEWEGILRFGRYCGLPLNDCARLRSKNLSHDRQTLCIPASDGGHQVFMPLGSQLVDHLNALPKASANTPLFPHCFQMSRGSLERQFKWLLRRAGIAAPSRGLGFASVFFVLGQAISASPNAGVVE